VADFDLDRLHRFITITRYATDLLLMTEIERGGELTFESSASIVPHKSDWAVEMTSNPALTPGPACAVGASQ
jgi:hypothetical protein